MLTKYELNKIVFSKSIFTKNVNTAFYLHKLILLEIYKYSHELNHCESSNILVKNHNNISERKIYIYLINLYFNKNLFEFFVFFKKSLNVYNKYINYVFNKINVSKKLKKYSYKRRKSIFYKSVFFKKHNNSSKTNYSFSYNKYIISSYILSNQNKHYSFAHVHTNKIKIVSISARLKISSNCKSYFSKVFNIINVNKINIFFEKKKNISLHFEFKKKRYIKNKYITKEFFKNSMGSIFKKNTLNKISHVNNIFSSSRFNNNSFLLPYFYKFTPMSDLNFFKNQFLLKTKTKKNDNKKYLNTFLPVVLKSSLSKNFYNNVNLQFSPSYDKYIVFYVLNFLEYYLNKNIWIKIKSSDLIEKNIKSILKKVASKNVSNQKSVGKELFIDEMYEILWISFNNRNVEFFADWLKKLMEKISLKKHKKIAKVIFNTLKKNKKIFFKFTGVVGFSLDIRGKLGVTGNAKKRHYSFTVGKISITSKKFPLFYYFNTVRTSTGVLGLSYYLMINDSINRKQSVDKETQL